MAHKIRMAFAKLQVNDKSALIKPRHGPTFNKEMPWGEFDGVGQGMAGPCGVGCVLHLSHDHFFRLKLGSGIGSNSPVELLALWVLLNFLRTKAYEISRLLGTLRLLLIGFWIKLV